MHSAVRVLGSSLSRHCFYTSWHHQRAAAGGRAAAAAAANVLSSHQSVRQRHGVPINTVIMFVPQQEAWVVERMGKYHRVLEPGVNVLVPVIDRVKYVQSLKEQAIEVPQQSAITSDNVTLSIDGVLYLRVVNPYRASYGVEDPEFAITQLAQTTMRSELGKIQLDKVFMERENLNVAIVESINKASETWGIQCMRYEIRDIKLPHNVQEAMQMQAQAERRKRASVLESEGSRLSEINVAEGHKRSVILASEAARLDQSNRAAGQAEALLAVARAQAEGLGIMASALRQSHGHEAACLALGERYMKAFSELAKHGTTLLLPHDLAEPAKMVTSSLAIYSKLANRPTEGASSAADKSPAAGSTHGESEH